VTVHVNAGDRVRRGQQLVTLDGRDLAANQLRAASEAAALERAQAAATANRAAAEAELGLARTSHARIATLHAHDAATTQELDEAASALQVAEARVTAAEAQASAAAASLAAARQAESAARAAASYAVLTAPVDGLITERLVDPGALATPGTPLLRIDNTSRFRLEVLVDASRLDSVAPGDAVEIAFGDSDGVEAPAVPMVRGTVSEIARAIDASSHSFLVKIDLPADVTLRSGMFGRVRFAGASQNLLTLPAAALVPQGQLSTVFVVSADRRAQMRVIDVGLRTPDWVEVLAGVSAGERVILSPTRVRDGVPVRDTGSGVRQ
jgi:RND family efflux transporter MFP subunit